MKITNIDSIQDPVIQQAIRQVQQYLTNLEKNYGIVPQDPNPVGHRTSAPAQPTFASVSASNGQFLIQITPPAIPGIILYEIQTSLTVPFTTSTSVKKYGPDFRLSWQITDPGVLKYVAVHAKFVNSPYSPLVVSPAGAVQT